MLKTIVKLYFFIFIIFYVIIILFLFLWGRWITGMLYYHYK